MLTFGKVNTKAFYTLRLAVCSIASIVCVIRVCYHRVPIGHVQMLYDTGSEAAENTEHDVTSV